MEARLTESDPERLEIGMPMELTLIPVPGASERATFAFRPAEEETSERRRRRRGRRPGIYEFGRHDGVSGLQMGAIAARRALANAGISWEDVDFAAGVRMRPATPTPQFRCSG